MTHTTSTSTAETGRGLMDQIKEGTTSQLSAQKDRATDGLGNLARAVRDTTQSLRNNQQDTIADYVEKAAQQIDRLSTELRGRDVGELMQNAQQLARRRPAIFMGAAFAAGVLAARFLKSSGAAAGRSAAGYGGGR